jgi:hypothetical protein
VFRETFTAVPEVFSEGPQARKPAPEDKSRIPRQCYARLS